MQTKNSQELQRLRDSVKAWFNHPKELNQRRAEAESGLSAAEQEFVEKLPAGSCLLDIGCATGRLCFALALQGYTITGIDVAEKLIEQAQLIAEKEQINVTFLHYEPPTLPFPDTSFEAVFLVKTYCYVPQRAARIAFLKEIARVLQSNGHLFISQHILDSVLDSYQPIYDANYHQFASEYETLEEGDNFILGVPSYIHCFFEADFKAELDESSFQLLDSSVKGELLSCVLQRQGTNV